MLWRFGGICLAVLCFSGKQRGIMALERNADDQQTGSTTMMALVAAILGVVLVIAGNPGWALLLEGSAAVLGAVGFFMAASPRMSGGALSILAIVIAV
jgi:hypothetical protein